MPILSRYVASSSATSGAGGLETTTTSSTESSWSSRQTASRVASPPTSADRSRPPTPRACVTPTPAWSSRVSSCWQPVPDAATRATGPGRQALAKPSPSPPTTAVPQSGPITRRPRSAAIRLSATSWSTGTLSLKSITSRPASRASTASTRALAPGTDTSVKASGVRRRAAPVVRGGAISPVPVAADRVVRAAATAARAASSEPSAASSASRTATTMSLDVASAGTVEAHLRQHGDVQLGRHRDLGGGDARRLRDLAAHLQQRDGVGVRPRPQLDVRCSCGHRLDAEREAGSFEQPAARRRADRRQRGLLGRTSPGQPRRELG